MGLFLFRFWPVLIPLLVYVLWWDMVGRKAVKAGQEKPLFREGPWYWLVISMLGVAVACFLWLGVTMEGKQGTYIPPHMDNGVMVPGRVEDSQ